MKTGARLLVGCGLLVAVSCTTPQADVFETDPIIAVGHGAFIGPDGRELAVDADFILRAQRYYRDRLERDGGAELRRESDEKWSLIDRLVDDEILANAVYIDWLLDRTRPIDFAQLTVTNNALRWRYWLEILNHPRPEGDEWTKGVGDEAAREMEEEGVPATVFLVTTAGGEAYRRECREAGVPVPDAMFSGEWAFQGSFDNEFISESSVPDLWLHESDSPPGICLALPRYPTGSPDDANLFGIICLGTQANKSCFFDNPRGRTFRRDVQVSLSEFVGGVDLVANAQGVCTDCHAGENPYVVHPLKPAFAGLPNLQPGGWPDPLVDASWPQNPGPTNLLDVVSSTGRCDACHQAGSAGRFPDVSTALPGYCGVVLATAVGSPPKRTMPLGGDPAQYTAHIDALKAACEAPPTGGGVLVDVDLRDDPGLLSPPIVVDPLYQCATRVAVRGAVLDAKVELFVNGSSVGSLIARSPWFEEFTVPALVAGDRVRAIQESAGVPSDSSALVVVRDHTVDFPGGLPEPEIDPTLIHQCGDIISVRHVPGALLTVLSNGADPRTTATSTGWTAVRPAKRPFDLGDSFTATAALCSDTSGLSGAESAVAPPPSIPAPGLNPATTYAGQELVTIENIVYGARVNVGETSFGPLGDFSWPVSWFPDFDVATPLGGPLSAGNSLTTAQRLCVAGPTATTSTVERCESLPAPRIRHPIAGTNYVIVTQSVPGARVRVYDDTGDELGDGSGTVIMLKRTLTGTDILTVVQQVGECTSRQGYRVSVRNPAARGDPQDDG